MLDAAALAAKYCVDFHVGVPRLSASVRVAMRGRGRGSSLAPRAVIECGDHALGDIITAAVASSFLSFFIDILCLKLAMLSLSLS